LGVLGWCVGRAVGAGSGGREVGGTDGSDWLGWVEGLGRGIGQECDIKRRCLTCGIELGEVELGSGSVLWVVGRR
jgi:hypothetical protein